MGRAAQCIKSNCRDAAVDATPARWRAPGVSEHPTHWLIYAQVKHPASGYVQGMNDLLAVFLVVLVDEVSEGDHVDVATLSDDVLDDVAADAYGLLNGVLESLDDHYVHRQPGLQRTIEEVDGLLRRVDADLHKHLDEVGVLLLQVTFRWINCLLVRELPMRCAIRLWDTCLAEERGFRTFFPYGRARRSSATSRTRSRRSPPRTCTSSSRRCRRRTGPTTRSRRSCPRSPHPPRRSSGPRRRTSSTSPTASPCGGFL